MQHVRIATYEIKDGNFQELADIARQGMLREVAESSPASSDTASPTSATGSSCR